jgi:hypothetical protein
MTIVFKGSEKMKSLILMGPLGLLGLNTQLQADPHSLDNKEFTCRCAHFNCGEGYVQAKLGEVVQVSGAVLDKYLPTPDIDKFKQAEVTLPAYTFNTHLTATYIRVKQPDDVLTTKGYSNISGWQCSIKSATDYFVIS